MKIWKKALSCFLALVMVVCLLPVTALATEAETVVAKIGGTEYTTLGAAITAAAEGDSITLLADVTIGKNDGNGTMSDGSRILYITKGLTLNLGGYTLTIDNASTYGIYINAAGKTVTIQNGTIDDVSGNSESVSNTNPVLVYDGDLATSDLTIKTTNPTQSGVYSYAVTVNSYNAADHVTLGSGTSIVEVQNDYATVDHESKQYGVCGVVIFGHYDTSAWNALEDKTSAMRSTLSVADGVTIDVAEFAVSTNGGYHPVDITINGGTLVSRKSTGIYFPGDGVLTITGGSITGQNSGVELRAGTLNMSGGSVTALATPTVSQANGNGTSVNGAAIAVSQHNTNLAIDVNISGGTLTGFIPLYEEDLQDSTTDNISLSVTGGSFVCAGEAEAGSSAESVAVYSKDCTSFITGGFFATSVAAYVDESIWAEVISKSNTETPYSYYTSVEEAAKNSDSGDTIIDLSTETSEKMVTVVVYAVVNDNFDAAETLYRGAALTGANKIEWLEENVTNLDRVGYTLGKWYNWDWKGHKVGSNDNFSGWTNVYVTYTANPYTVSFDANMDGIEDPEAQTVTYGEPYGELPVLSLANYTFAGWALEDGTIVNAETAVATAADHTLTAVWAVTQPQTPGASTTNTSKTLFTIQCDTVEEHQHVSNWFGSHVTYVKDSLEWDADRGVWTCEAKINLSIFNITTAIRNGSFGGYQHHYTNYNGETYTQYPVIHLVWDPDVTGLNSQGNEVTGLWVGDGDQVVHWWCYTEPAAPTVAGSIASGLSSKLWLRDSNNTKIYYRFLKAQWTATPFVDTLSIGDIYEEDGTYYCDVTINDLAPYIAYFNENKNSSECPYVVDEENNAYTENEYVYVFEYTGSTSDYKQDGSGWTWNADKSVKNSGTGLGQGGNKNNGMILWLKQAHTVEYVEAIAPTCEEDGVLAHWHCTVCDKNYEDEACTTELTSVVDPALGHDWQVVHTHDGTTCGDHSDTTYQCSRCMKIKVETSEPLAHELGEVITVEPTCTEGGYSYQVCARCGAIYLVENSETDALGHEWTDQIISEATCTETGLKQQVCERCGAYGAVAVIPETGHTIVTDESVEPTCTEPGLTEGSHCSVCNAVLTEQEEIPALGHDWDEGTVTIEATCTTDGVMTYTCKNNPEHTYTETIAAVDHTWDEGVVTSEATCTDDGILTYTCSACSTTKTETISAIGHAWDSGVVTTSATCGQTGVITYTCENDSSHTMTENIPATGNHTWDCGEVTTKPTYQTEGERTYTCSVCGATCTEAIPKLTYVPVLDVVEMVLPILDTQVNDPFVDVNATNYYYDAVNWAVDEGITTGTGRYSFSPDEACTRAQAVTFLWRAAGSPAPKSETTVFVDVDPDAYYAEAVAWAVENGITDGTSPTTFSPYETCTRAHIVTFLYRAYGTVVDNTIPFTDVASNAYYAPAVAWAAAEGVTGGTTPTTFSPAATCTRAQIVTFLYRACK